MRRSTPLLFVGLLSCWFCAVIPSSGYSAPAATGAAASPLPDGTKTHQYTISFFGKLSGRMIVNVLPNGRITTDFSYRDNGRGPDIFEEISVDANGQFESFNASGKSTFGAPIAERFSRVNGKATWQSKADTGEVANVPTAIYVPIESSFEASSVVVRALLGAPGNKLAALPNGQLSIEQVLDAAVVRGKVSAVVTLYQVSGLSFEPNYIWMWKTATPAKARLFGIVSPGFAAIESGWVVGQADRANLLV